MRLVFALLAVALALGAAPAPSAAKSNETIYIAPGLPVASYSDKLNGPQVRDYVYPASKGQKMDVSLSSKSDAVFFKIKTPSGDTLYNSAKSGNYPTGIKIKRGGNYTIRVYLKKVEKGHIRHYSLVMKLK